MRFKTHLLAGISFAIMGYLLSVSIRYMAPPSADMILDFTLSNMLLPALALITAAISSVLPDILDPPFTYKHRKYAHSKQLMVLFLLIYVFTLFLIYDDIILEIWVVHFFSLGYTSHLVLDSLTPMGLYG